MKAIPPHGTIAFLEAWNIGVLIIIIFRFWVRRYKLRVPRTTASTAANVQLILAWLIITAAQSTTINGLIDIIHYRDTENHNPLKHPLLQPKFHKINFWMVLAYFTVLWLAKGAFIAFFFDLFPRHGLSKGLRIALYGTVVYTVAGYTANVLIHLLLCRPIETGWLIGPGNCNSLRNPITLTATTCINITTDVILMALPITILRTLSLKRREFIGLTLVFLVGLTTIICAIIRYIVIHETNSQDHEGPEGKINDISVIQVWSYIEAYFAIITFCLPAFRILLNSRRRTGRRTTCSVLPRYGQSTLQRSHLRKGTEKKSRPSSADSITRADIEASDPQWYISSYSDHIMSPVDSVETSDFLNDKAILPPPKAYEKQAGLVNHMVCNTPPYVPP